MIHSHYTRRAVNVRLILVIFANLGRLAQAAVIDSSSPTSVCCASELPIQIEITEGDYMPILVHDYWLSSGASPPGIKGAFPPDLHCYA
jgi:hypothetical protein